MKGREKEKIKERLRDMKKREKKQERNERERDTFEKIMKNKSLSKVDLFS